MLRWGKESLRHSSKRDGYDARMTTLVIEKEITTKLEQSITASGRMKRKKVGRCELYF